MLCIFTLSFLAVWVMGHKPIVLSEATSSGNSNADCRICRQQFLCLYSISLFIAWALLTVLMSSFQMAQKWLRGCWGFFSVYFLYVQVQYNHIFLPYSVVSFLNILLCLPFVTQSYFANFTVICFAVTKAQPHLLLLPSRYELLQKGLMGQLVEAK